MPHNRGSGSHRPALERRLLCSRLLLLVPVVGINIIIILNVKKSLKLVNPVISYLLRFKDDGSAPSENGRFTVRSYAMHCAKRISP